tara:strand:+ start:904 stop:1416 length:513 start_codon:yes stop_codon:yes gene_type:complete
MASILKTDKIEGVTASGTVQMPAGHVVQVLSTTKVDDHFQSTSTSFVDVTGVTLTISPKFSTSKVLVTVSGAYGVNTASRIALFNIVRDSTNLGQPTSAKSFSSTRTLYYSGADELHQLHIEFLDSPATTSATVYKLQMKINSSGTLFIGDRANEDCRQGTTITLKEIAQ